MDIKFPVGTWVWDVFKFLGPAGGIIKGADEYTCMNFDPAQPVPLYTVETEGGVQKKIAECWLRTSKEPTDERSTPSR